MLKSPDLPEEQARKEENLARNKELARRLKFAMESARPTLSQSDIATACGTSPQAITGWLKNGLIDKFKLPIIVAKTGCSYAYFLDHKHVFDADARTQLELLRGDEKLDLELLRAASPAWRTLLRYLAALRPPTDPPGSP